MRKAKSTVPITRVHKEIWEETVGWKVTCSECERAFPSQRKETRTCSERCRQRRSRRLRKRRAREQGKR